MTVRDYVQKLAPRTTWHKIPIPAAIASMPDAIALGTFVQPCRDPLRMIITVDLMDRSQAGHWLHLSVSRERRLPTWGDLVAARDAAGYGDRFFVQLVPPASHWLNRHPYTLHLFHRLDQETIPRPVWDQQGVGPEQYGDHRQSP